MVCSEHLQVRLSGLKTLTTSICQIIYWIAYNPDNLRSLKTNQKEGSLMYNIFYYQIVWIGVLLSLLVMGKALPVNCQTESDADAKIFSYSYEIPTTDSLIKDRQVSAAKKTDPALKKIVIYCVFRGNQSQSIKLGFKGENKLYEGISETSAYKEFRSILTSYSINEADKKLQEVIGLSDEKGRGKWGPNDWAKFREFLNKPDASPYKIIDLNKFINEKSLERKGLEDLLEKGGPNLRSSMFAEKIKKDYESLSHEQDRVSSQGTTTMTTTKAPVKKSHLTLILITSFGGIAIVIIVCVVVFLLMLGKLEVEGKNLKKRVECLDSAIQKLPPKKPEKIKEEERKDTPASSLGAQLSSHSESIRQLTTQSDVLKKEITKINEDIKKLTNPHEGTSKDITNLHTSLSNIEGNIEKIEKNLLSLAKTDDGLEKTINEKDNDMQNLDSLKKWYKGLAEDICKKYVEEQTGVPQQVNSDEITEKIKKVSIIVTDLKNQINSEDREQCKEILEAVKDFEGLVQQRMNIFTSQTIVPKVRKEIREYEEFKKEKNKELIKSLLSEEGSDFDIEEEYRKYVTAKYNKWLRDIVKELKTEGARFVDSNKSHLQEYEDFIRRDLVNVFVSAIDTLKFVKGKKIPQEIESSLKAIFNIVEIEEIPVEPRKTKADAREHTIKETKIGDYEDGTVIDVVFRGIRYKSDEKVIKKPVVIGGEKK